MELTGIEEAVEFDDLAAYLKTNALRIVSVEEIEPCLFLAQCEERNRDNAQSRPDPSRTVPMTAYSDFLASKQQYGSESGFAPVFMPSFLYDFQQYLVDWSVRKGRAAIFADCGLGKTPMQLVWAQNVIEKTNRPVLILTPLAVSRQTLDEAEKFGIKAKRAQPDLISPVIVVTNYEKLHLFNPANYSGIVCDESSILKNFDGVRRQQITEFMRTMPYRLLCTATAAPNDWTELGTSSEALGYLGQRDMLTRFFSRKAHYARDRGKRKEWNLRGWAEDGPFWQWLSSWARTAQKPSDLGYDDDGFILPPLNIVETHVKAENPTPGRLFDMAAVTFHEEREAIRRTITERCEAAAASISENGQSSMVWCNLNDEGDLLTSLIPDAVQVSGSDSDEAKEDAAHWFVHGTGHRVLVSKPTIFGFGLNFQHCHHMTYFPTWSYEQYYQATRRLWRFGQEMPVTVELVYTDGGKRMLEGLKLKEDHAKQMFESLVEHMHKELSIKDDYHEERIEVPQWMM